MIGKLLKLTPEKSNRQIAADVGVDHKTVQAVRVEAEDGGEIPHHAARVGKDGIVQPARKTAAKPKASKPKAHFTDDPDFQAEAEAAARDLEIERDERIALSGGAELAAENEQLRKQVGGLDRRIAALINENSSLKYREKHVEAASHRRRLRRGAPMPDLFPGQVKDLVLHDYQQAAIDSARENIRKGHRRQILCAPTGSGKTIIGLGLDAGRRKGGLTQRVHHRPQRPDRPDLDGDGLRTASTTASCRRRTGDAGPTTLVQLVSAQTLGASARQWRLRRPPPARPAVRR